MIEVKRRRRVALGTLMTVMFENRDIMRLQIQEMVRIEINEQHAAGLTRDDVTAAVHYLTFNFTPEQMNAFEAGPATVECSQPNYLEASALSDSTKTEPLTDLLP
jgi:hypothetical protein